MAQDNPSGPIPDMNNIETSGPYAGLPVLAPGFAWTQFPYNSSFLEDPLWYDGMGVSQLERRRVFDISNQDELASALDELLNEFPGRGMHILFKAAVKGKPDAIKFLLSRGVRAHPCADEGDDMSCVPAHAAAYNGNLDCLKLLMEDGKVDVDAKDELGGTPLMRAAWGGRAEIVRWLIESGADPTVVQSSTEADVNAFEFAAGSGDVESVKILFAASLEKVGGGAQQQESIVTPQALQAAASSGNTDTLQFLLDKAGYPLDDAEQKTWKGAHLGESQKHDIELALGRAQDADAGLLRMLLTYLAQPDETGKIPFCDTTPATKGGLLITATNAISRGDTEAFEVVWRTTLDDARSETIQLEDELLPKRDVINNMLVTAVGKGQLGSVRLLVQQHGASVHDACGPNFTTPLYLAVCCNHGEMAEYMLASLNSDIDQASGRYANGPTALAIAVMRGSSVMAKLLLRHGGPVEKIEQRVEPEKAKKLIVSTMKVYRQRVTVTFSEKEDSLEEQEGLSVVEVDLMPDDAHWLRRIRLRKSDEELAASDPFKRELRAPDGDPIST